jgi:predicted ester cyclase
MINFAASARGIRSDRRRVTSAATVWPGELGVVMRRIQVIASAVLLLITVSVSGLAAVTFGHANSDARPTSTVAEQAVRDFYDAINQTLRSGNPTVLQRQLSPEFVSHDQGQSNPFDAASFAARIVNLKSALPNSQVVPDTISASGNLVAARVTFESAGGGTLLGLPAPFDAFWGPTDVFRVRGGKIAEHWGSAPEGMAVSRAIQTPFPVTRTDHMVLQMSELTVRGEQSHTIYASTFPSIFRVQSGHFNATPRRSPDNGTGVAISGQEGRSLLPPGSDTQVGPGDFIIVPAGFGVSLSNPNTDEAVLLELSRALPMSGGEVGVASYDRGPAPVTRVVIFVSPALPVTPGTYRLEFGQLGLPVGAGFSAQVIGTSQLILVERGQLSALSSGPKLWVTDGSTGIMRITSAATLVRSDGVVTPGSVELSLYSTGDEPTVLLIARLVPAAAG